MDVLSRNRSLKGIVLKEEDKKASSYKVNGGKEKVDIKKSVEVLKIKTVTHIENVVETAENKKKGVVENVNRLKVKINETGYVTFSSEGFAILAYSHNTFNNI